MKKVLVPLTILVVLCTGYSLNWLQGETPSIKNRPRLSNHETYASDAVMRHKRCQPNHWRALVLNQH